MRVNHIEAQFVGKSRFEDRNDNSKSRWYCHFIYKSDYIVGYGTIVFPIYDNNSHVKVDDMNIQDNYKIVYVSDRGYNTLVTIDKI